MLPRRVKPMRQFNFNRPDFFTHMQIPSHAIFDEVRVFTIAPIRQTSVFRPRRWWERFLVRRNIDRNTAARAVVRRGGNLV